jgi:hypothetical protein
MTGYRGVPERSAEQQDQPAHGCATDEEHRTDGHSPPGDDEDHGRHASEVVGLRAPEDLSEPPDEAPGSCDDQASLRAHTGYGVADLVAYQREAVVIGSESTPAAPEVASAAAATREAATVGGSLIDDCA